MVSIHIAHSALNGALIFLQIRDFLHFYYYDI